MVRVRIKWTMKGAQVSDSREMNLTDCGFLVLQRADLAERSHLVCGLLGVDAKKVFCVELECLCGDD